jgi:nucleotide-binding universal stress UspA family protein
MSAWDVIGPLAALLIGAIAGHYVWRRRREDAEPHASQAKILFPFVGRELSERALQATLRLAWAEQATVVPAYLATVPMQLALDVPVAKSCEEAFDVFEAIEQRAAPIGVPVDGRIARGRNVRHALRMLLREVPGAERIVVAAASNGGHDGFSVDDVAWLLRNAPGEVLVVRPDPALRAFPLPMRAREDVLA